MYVGILQKGGEVMDRVVERVHRSRGSSSVTRSQAGTVRRHLVLWDEWYQSAFS